MYEQSERDTSCAAAEGLIRSAEETLALLAPCPKKLRLGRVCSSLRREQAALEKAARDCDAVSERKALYRIASKTARFYRVLGADGLG